MKKQLFLLVAFFATISASYAQTVKYGSVKINEIISVMPEADSVQMKLEEHAVKLRSEMEEMKQEFQTKYEGFQKNQASYSNVMLQQKQKELEDSNNSIQEFGRIAEAELEKKQNEYMTPIIEKLNSVIKQVCVAEGISFVVNPAQPAFVYMDEKMLIDITPMVKATLGL